MLLAIKNCGQRLDFARFYIYFKDKYKIDRAFIFIGYLHDNESLYTYLQQAGYIVIFKPTLFYKDKDGNKKIKGNLENKVGKRKK